MILEWRKYQILANKMETRAWSSWVKLRCFKRVSFRGSRSKRVMNGDFSAFVVKFFKNNIYRECLYSLFNCQLCKKILIIFF